MLGCDPVRHIAASTAWARSGCRAIPHRYQAAIGAGPDRRGRRVRGRGSAPTTARLIRCDSRIRRDRPARPPGGAQRATHRRVRAEHGDAPRGHPPGKPRGAPAVRGGSESFDLRPGTSQDGMLSCHLVGGADRIVEHCDAQLVTFEEPAKVQPGIRIRGAVRPSGSGRPGARTIRCIPRGSHQDGRASMSPWSHRTTR